MNILFIIPENENTFKLANSQNIKPLSMYRLLLTEIIITACTASTISSIPIEFWKTVTNWFFKCGQHNIFQCHYFNMVKLAIQSNDDNVMKILLGTELNLISRLIASYKSTEFKELRGFILLLCNLFRLESARQEKKLLVEYLSASEDWKTFESELRNQTTLQAQIPSGKLSANFRIQVSPNKLPSHINIPKTNGIDLGSHCIYYYLNIKTYRCCYAWIF